MLTINRRKIILSAVGGAAGALLGGSLTHAALAQAAPAPLIGNAAVYRFMVGDIAATVVSDGLIGGPPTIYAGDAPEAELEEVLRNAFLPTDFMTLNLNTLLLEIGGRRILLEASAGHTMGPNGGRLFQNLEALGLSGADIDIVVISHTHPDHVGNFGSASPQISSRALSPSLGTLSSTKRATKSCQASQPYQRSVTPQGWLTSSSIRAPSKYC